MALRLIPPSLSALLLAAHFLRRGQFVPAVVCLLAPLLLLVPRRWSLRAVQLFLLAGAALWGQLTWQLVRERASAGVPWLRLALILGAVTALTLLSAWLLQSTTVRARYRGNVKP